MDLSSAVHDRFIYRDRNLDIEEIARLETFFLAAAVSAVVLCYLECAVLPGMCVSGMPTVYRQRISIQTIEPETDKELIYI